MSNTVYLEGQLGRSKTGNGGKGAWAFFSVKPNGERAYIECAAFGPPAEVIAGLSEGAALRLTGRLGSTKDKLLGEKVGKDVWKLQVVADDNGGKIEVPAAGVAGRGGAEDEIAF